MMPDWGTLLRQLAADWPAGMGVWVVASIALHIVGSWGWWLLRRSPWGEEIQQSAWGYAARWLLCLLYLAGIPYLALLLGVASPRLLGLRDLDWILGLGIGGGMALAGMAVWLVAFWSYRYFVPRAYDGDEPPWVLGLLEAAALQFHWAFYRHLTLLWLDDAYWGVWGSLLFVGLEGVLATALWQRRTQAQVERSVSQAVLWLVTTTLFYYTRNLWLCLAFHGVTVLAMARGLPAMRHRPHGWMLSNEEG